MKQARNRRIRTLLAYLGGIVSALGFGWTVSIGREQNAALGVAVGLAVLTVLLVAIGTNLLLTARRLEAGEDVPASDYRHTIPVFAVLVGVVLVGVGLRGLAVPETFGQFGHFRGAAATEARVKTPRHLGKDACKKCHEKELTLHDKDMHAAVQCETCHGAGSAHVADPKKVHLVKPNTKQDCLVCHQAMAARPGRFPQIQWRDHFKFAGVDDEKIECVKCHSPHEPLFLDRDVRKARLHPMINRCRDCHVGRTDATLKQPDDHPPLFQCNYCHKEIAAKFAQLPHAKIDCTTCHIFQQVSDTAGRIVRDADPRFCLLCHGAADFRSKNGPPTIEWPAHRDEMGSGEEDATKRCVDCHQENYIHPVGHAALLPAAVAPAGEVTATAPAADPTATAGQEETK